ncbi:MAG: hypothetical protein Q4P29_07135 [Tissierellia bacterium]|nr:hypothetical protein [Tissierellia bacterium]
MNKLVLASIISGLIGGIFWLIGDILIVGYDEYDIHDEKYFHIMDKNSGYTMFLEAKEKNLRYGAMCGQWSSPLLILAIYSVYHFMGRGIYAIIVSTFLLIGVCYSPLAHAVFYYTARISQMRYHLYKNGYSMEDKFLKNLDLGHKKMVYSSWLPAITFTGIAWVLFALGLFLVPSKLPKIFVLLNPTCLSVIIGLISKKKTKIRHLIRGATFNIATVIYSVSALIAYLNNPF